MLSREGETKRTSMREKKKVRRVMTKRNIKKTVTFFFLKNPNKPFQVNALQLNATSDYSRTFN